MENKLGFIYKITNKINNKIYIGQTSSLLKDKEKAVIKRFKNHIYTAEKKIKNAVPLLGNAIRKYGKDNFEVTQIDECKYDIKVLDDLEIYYINKYNSTDKKIGYNISKGGGGASVPMTEDKRKKISSGQIKDKTPDMLGIIKKYRNNILVGYRAQRKQEGKKYEKVFSDSSKSLEENLSMAKKYLQDLIDNDIDKYKKFNKESDLPQNIYKEKDIGYRFQIIFKKKVYTKVFTQVFYSLEEKLKQAIDEKNKFIEYNNKYNKNEISVDEYNAYMSELEQKPQEKKSGLEPNIMKEWVKGNHMGYRFQIKYNKKIIAKTFKDKSLSLDEKLQLALNAKKEFFSKNVIIEQK